MNELSEKPWWYPVLCDADCFTQLRRDYPEFAGWSDEELHEHFNDGSKYAALWDHTGDAYEQFEKLADAFLELESKVKELKAVIEAERDMKDDARTLVISIAHSLDVKWEPHQTFEERLFDEIGLLYAKMRQMEATIERVMRVGFNVRWNADSEYCDGWKACRKQVEAALNPK